MTKKKNIDKNLIEIKRGIDPKVKVLLFSKTAGRCQLCNELVTKDKLTNKDVIWGEMAHIYAFNIGGPRFKLDKAYNNDVQNLLLACPSCHGKIDKKELVKDYSVEYLKTIKKESEDRIRLVTNYKSNRATKILKMVANINNEVIALSNNEMVDALMKEKLFSCEDNPEEINFTSTSSANNTIYWKSKKQEIDNILKRFYDSLGRDKVKYISVFPIGPIPLLVYLGNRLENKINTIIFQRHRDGENWIWKKSKPKAKYKFRVKNGKNKSKVALLLSLSGFIDKSLLPRKIKDEYYLYEIYLDGNPNYNFLRTRKDLENFEKFFTTKISEIKNNHKSLKEINLFPAIPAPIAVVCGRSLNRNSDPELKIYNTVNKNKFKYTLTIN